MKRTIFVFVLMISFSIFAQVEPRKLVNGKIIANQNIDNVTIYNTTTQKGAISNIDGEFSIFAKANDTLVVASLVFQTKKIAMKESDFELITFNVKLEEKVNQLEEVVVSNNSLTGNLKIDADNIKIHKIDSKLKVGVALQTSFEDDNRSSPVNQAMHNFAPDKYGMNFVEIGKMIGKALNISGKPKNKTSNNQPKVVSNFKDYVLDAYPFSFFEKDLKINREEIGVFLDFCADDYEVTSTFLSKNKLERIDLLYQKKQEYDQNKK